MGCGSIGWITLRRCARTTPARSRSACDRGRFRSSFDTRPSTRSTTRGRWRTRTSPPRSETDMTMQTAGSLEEALAGARAADQTTRILWRDAIASYGPAAIDAMFEWAGDKDYGAFAVRVIGKVGELGWTAEALDALSAFRSIGVSEKVRNDSEEAIEFLRPTGASHSSLRHRVRLHANAGLDWPGFQPT